MPDLFTRLNSRTVARALLGTFIVLWLVTGSNLFGYRYWNVTQDKYEAALAKWHSLAVEEYEETLDLYSSGKWKFVVRVEHVGVNRVEKVISLQSLDETSTDLKEKHGWNAEEFERYWTVDAMFQGISLLLERPDRLDPNLEEHATDFTWVEFDPNMGFPSSYTATYNRAELLQLLSMDIHVLK